MSTSEALMWAGAEATMEVAFDMIKAAGEALKRHGPDPNSPAILGAAFCMAIDKITSEVDPQFKRRLLIQLLEGPQAKRIPGD